MKKLILLIVAGLCLPALGQSNGVYNATTYAYTTQVTQGNSATGSSSILANPTAFAQGMPFLPYNLNASITINRNAATAETLAPSAIANCFPNSLTCTLSGTFSFKHISGESIQSGTFGLQEAINIAIVAGSGTVVIDASWQGPSGTSVILAAKGASSVMIQDNRNPSGATFYQWNGSAYAASGGTGGAVSSVFTRTGPVTAQTGDYTCAQVTGCASTAIQSINGDTTAAQHIAGTGGITCSTAGGTTTCNYAGSAGSGTVATGLQYQSTCYTASGSNTVVGPCPHVWTINPAITGTQMTTFLATLTSTDVVQIPPAFGQTPFTNTTNVTIRDYRQGAAMVQFGQYGIACGAQTVPLTLPSGNTWNVGASLSSANIGQTIFIGGRTGYGVDAPQYSWLPTITAYTFPNITLSSSTPAGMVGFTGQFWVGWDNTAQLTTALADSNSLFPLAVPAGCFLMTQAVPWTQEASIIAQAPSASGIIFAPGQDGIFQVDSANSAVGSAVVRNLQVFVDQTIDRTQGGYTAYNAAGTGTVVAPLYRPLHMGQPDTNNPLGPGWAQNAFNGVASTTQNSAIICYSTASGQHAPTVGNQIVFRDFPTGVYVTTVSSLTGSGCSGANSPATLAATFPNTSGYTQTQIEWVSTSSVLTSSTALPSTINYPFTITVNQSIAPVSSTVANVAQHGHVFIAGQQFDYLGVSYLSPYTITLRRGPSTCSGADCSAGFAIVPSNPCEADYTVPYPVVPTINSGDSTPHGANYFPGECGGNFGFSFPQVNGNTNADGGLVNAVLNDDVCSVAVGPQITNNAGCMYFGGNAAPYGSIIDGLKVNFLNYGIVQGPASYGQHGVSLVGPTGAGNSIRNCTIHAAYPIILADFQNGKIDRCDTYPTETNPYDGSVIGASTWISADATQDEQTGLGVTVVTFLDVNSSFGEPENGTHAENPPGVQSGASFTNWTNDNLEGVYNVFSGSYQKIIGGQLSPPVVLYGQNITIDGVYGLNLGYVTNVWGSQFLNWGYFNHCGAIAGGGTGPIVDCGIAVVSTESGQSAEAFYHGNTEPVRNLQQAMIKPGEWNANGQFDSAPMASNSQIDPTEPGWGWSASCNLGGAAQCQPWHFDGLNGNIFIGPHQRIPDAPVFIQADWKTVTASSSFTLLISAFDNGSGTCGSPGTVASFTISTTTTWTPWISTPFSLAGRAGCIFAPQLFAASTTDTFKVGYFNIFPAPNWIMPPTTAPTEGAACPAGTPYGAWLGAFSGFTYFCDGGTVHRVAIS